MSQKEVEALLLFLNAGIKVLGARVVLIVTLLLTFSLFCWVAYEPGPYRLGTAVAFAILVFLPVIRMDSKQATKQEGE